MMIIIVLREPIFPVAALAAAFFLPDCRRTAMMKWKEGWDESPLNSSAALLRDFFLVLEINSVMTCRHCSVCNIEFPTGEIHGFSMSFHTAMLFDSQDFLLIFDWIFRRGGGGT